MGSCGKSTILDDASGGSVIGQHLCSEFPLQSIPLQRSCSVVTCNSLDSNFDCSNVLEGCKDVSEHVHSGSASFIDAPVTSRDSLLMVGKNENTDILLLEKTSDNDNQTCTSTCCEQIKVSDLESFRLSSEEKPFDKDGQEMTSESVLTRGSPKGSAQQVVQKDEKINIFSSTGVSPALMVDKNDTGVLNDACIHTTDFRDSGTSLDSESMTELLVDCHKKSEQEDIMTKADPLLEVVNKCDSLCGIDADSCKLITPSQGSEVPADVMYTEVESVSDLLHGQKVGEDGSSPCEDFVDKESIIDTHVQVSSSPGCQRIDTDSCKLISPRQGSEVATDVTYTEVESVSDQLHDQKVGEDGSSSREDFVDKESIIDIHAQVPSSPGCQRIMGNLLVDSPGKVTQGIDKTNIDFNVADEMKIVEQKFDVVNEINVEMKNNISQVDDKSCKLNDSSMESNANCALRKTISLESGLPSVVYINNSSSKDVSDLLPKGENGSISYSSVAGNSGQADSIIKVDCVLESKCSEVAPLPFQRNGRRSKSGHKTQTKRASRKCKNKVSMPLIILEAARKKRSCFSKPARSSIWGLVGNINKFFEWDNEVGVDEVMSQGLRKVRGTRKSGKANKNGAISSSVSSMKKCCASTTRVRLKIKLGKEVNLSCSNVLISKVLDGSGSASSLGPGLGSQKVTINAVDKFSEEVVMGEFESFKNNVDKNAHVLNGKIANKHLESTATLEKSDGVAEELCPMIPPERMVEPLREAINNKGMDPGTSPDSEVINSIPEVQVGERHPEGVHDAILGSSKELNSLVEVAGCKRGKKKDKLTSSSSCIVENGSQCLPRKSKTKHSKNRGRKENFNDAVCSMDLLTSNVINAASNVLNSKELSIEPLPLSGEIELEDSTKVLKVKSSMEVKTTCNPDVDHELSESQGIENLQSSTRAFGNELPNSLKSSKVSKTKSKASDSMSRKKAGSRRREKQQKPVKKSEVKRKGVSEKVIYEVEDHSHTENGVDGDYKLDAIGKNNTDDDKVSVNVSHLDMALDVGLEEHHVSPHNAWVRCDDCHKWRRIPVELADQIEETKCTWTCKDSNDEAFADCSIPQEKSNAEINAELGLSDASGEEDAYEGRKNYKELGYRPPIVYQESTFTHILSNEFLHRCRKTQTIDEIMVCHCKPLSEGRFGCGDECLNRMLNIECVQGTCPCGDHCSNQQFQQRKYASLSWFKSGKKGYGLKAQEDISEGQFLIEYVGEVLDVHAYEARQREYAFKGHRHFYFMTLNGSEVIDASAKGNLGRFINHSCDPNCRTEKWMVNGEICIGLFALRDIKQDEEVTFDYNYVRVFGAAAKKCYCGSPLCRGYIGGGDPLNAEVVVQGDSDEEFPEPVMLNEDGEIEDNIPRSNVVTQADRNLLKARDLVDKSRSALVPDNNQEIENSMDPASAISQLHCSLEVEDSIVKLPSSVHVDQFSQQMEDVNSKSMPAVQQGYVVEAELPEKTSTIQRSETCTATISKGISKPKSELVEDRPGFSKSNLLVKSSRVKGSVKKGKVHANHSNGLKTVVTANRLQISSIKPKKMVEGSSNGRFEAVQEKLKELLDEDGEGGISKRKDATKGYLKLLLLTVASGDRNNGEAIQSNRDLSMILGALLKTKSRAVLNDIINKNGLQMLHNIMKQYRRDFKKTPILRKLLKVLEHLAASKILTFEHINGGPPCRGMESFRESMLSLTEHDDKQVHQIARSFRDRWIPRPLRKHGYMDRDDYRVESHRNFNCNRFSASQSHRREQDIRPTEAIDSVQQSKVLITSADAGPQEGCSALSLDGSAINGTKRRKRKSRWDQPAETISDSSSNPCKKQSIDSGLLMQTDAAINSFDGSQNVTEDFPPGFSCPVQPQLGSLNASPQSGDLALQNAGNSGCVTNTVIGHQKEKFNSLLSVSYGMPLSLVQQYGTPHAEIAGSWVTAPGIPFIPFPPLPPYPRDNKDCQPSNSANAMSIDQPRDMSGPVSSNSDDMTPSTTGASSDSIDLLNEEDNHLSKRVKGSSCDLGRRYFRQQKWNNSKIHRPWFRKNAWGNNTTGGMCSIGVGDELNESKVTCSSEDVICRVEKGDNNV